MTHHDGTHDHTDGAAAEPSTQSSAGTDPADTDAEAADYVHAVDRGVGTDEELTDGADKGDFTTSSDHGDGAKAAPNALREAGDYVSSPENDDGKAGEYVDPVDHGRDAQ